MQKIVDMFSDNGARFFIPNFDKTEHTQIDVMNSYERFYDYATTPADPKYSDIVYSILFNIDGSKSGFFLRTHDIGFIYKGKWGEDSIKCVEMSYPKGYQINIDDKHYIYDEIEKHQPKTYALYHDVVNEIKKVTIPLRFSSISVDSVKEQKTSVRISEFGAKDLSDSWIFKKYSLVMNSYSKN